MKALSTFLFSLLLINFTTPAQAAQVAPIYAHLQGNYLITYTENSENKIRSAPNILLHNNLLHIYNYEDSLLAQHRPVDTYYFLKKTKKDQDSVIKKLYALSQLDNKRYGSYRDSDKNDGNYVIEGRYNKKSFIITINEYGRHYEDKGVTKSNLLNRDDLFNKLPYFKTGEKSKLYIPTYLRVLASKSEIIYDPQSIENYMEFDGTITLGCNKIKYENYKILPFSGIYLINKESLYHLSVSPLLPGMTACE
jgi:hypothetical protein